MGARRVGVGQHMPACSGISRILLEASPLPLPLMKGTKDWMTRCGSDLREGKKNLLFLRKDKEVLKRQSPRAAISHGQSRQARLHVAPVCASVWCLCVHRVHRRSGRGLSPRAKVSGSATASGGPRRTAARETGQEGCVGGKGVGRGVAPGWRGCSDDDGGILWCGLGGWQHFARWLHLVLEAAVLLRFAHATSGSVPAM